MIYGQGGTTTGYNTHYTGTNGYFSMLLASTRPTNKLLAFQKDVFDISKVTVVGSPTITSDGVASGFSQTNKINSSVALTNNLEISLEVKLSENIDSDQEYFFQIYSGSTNYFDIRRYQKHINFLYRNTNNSYGLGYQWINKAEANKTYKFKIVQNGNNIAFYADDVLLGTKADAFTLDNPTYSISFGSSSNNQYPLTGSIDLTAFKIYVDGKLVFQPVKPTYLLERRKEGFDPSKFTVVGSPTITEDGVASGFSNSSYIKQNISLQGVYTLKGEITIGTINEQNIPLGVNANNALLLSLRVDSSNSRMVLVAKNTSGNNTILYTSNNFITSGNKYSFEIIVNGSSLTFKLNNSIVGTMSNFDNIETQFITLGVDRSFTFPFTGSIDLSQFSITVDGKEVFTGAKENFYMLRR